jgi:SAM-dependent methyltransferase
MESPMTVDYYNHNADAFQQRTRECGVSRLHEAFASLLPPGAHILDAGCGPGRDAVAFVNRGFRVTAFDASSAMVDLATKTTGQPVLLMTFAELAFEEQFDGIWANASLLHVRQTEIDDVLARLAKALKPAGVLYMSVKVGDGERILPDGRVFCDYTENSLRETIGRQPSFTILNIHQSAVDPRQTDPRPWLHATMRKLQLEPMALRAP